MVERRGGMRASAENKGACLYAGVFACVSLTRTWLSVAEGSSVYLKALVFLRKVWSGGVCECVFVSRAERGPRLIPPMSTSRSFYMH